MCTWTGHCIGDTCSKDEDCDLDYACVSRKCSSGGSAPAVTTIRTTARPGQGGGRTTTIFVTAPRPTTTARTTSRPGQGQPTCEWEGHCLGATCKTENDCDGQLACVSGRCANPGSTPATSTRPGGGQPTIRTTVQTLRTTARTTAKPQPTGQPGGTPACGDNPLACIGVSCRQDFDCGFELIICKNGVCSL